MLDAEARPLIADFSLAKFLSDLTPPDACVTKKGNSKKQKKRKREATLPAVERLHTAGAGTPTYTAPEIANGEEGYGLKADVWSMGVVLYEMFTGSALPVYKDKRAFSLLEQAKEKMSNKPIPALIKRMLEVDPEIRPSAKEALDSLPGVEGMDLPTPQGKVLEHQCEAPTRCANAPGKRARGKAGGAGEISAEVICRLLDAANPATGRLANQLYRLSASAMEGGADGMAACALLAYKMKEVDTIDPEDVVDLDHAVSCWVSLFVD